MGAIAMPGKSHSRATKLGAVFLAKLAGLEVAATTFRLDVRTVQAWQRKGDLPDDQWEAIEQTLLARGSEMAAKGDTRGLVQTLTGAGIASRNTRYRQLIAQREQRKVAEAQAEQPERSRSDELVHSLSNERGRYVRDWLDCEIQRRQDEQSEAQPVKTEAEWMDEWCGFLERIRDMPEEEFGKQRAELDALMAKQDRRSKEQHPWRTGGTPLEPPQPAEPPHEPPGPMELPTRRSPGPPVAVLPAGFHLEDHPTWRPGWRSDNPWREPR